MNDLDYLKRLAKWTIVIIWALGTLNIWLAYQASKLIVLTCGGG